MGLSVAPRPNAPIGGNEMGGDWVVRRGYSPFGWTLRPRAEGLEHWAITWGQRRTQTWESKAER